MDAFLSDNSTTQAQCNHLAEQHFSGPVVPFSVQGSFSYTVIAETSEGEIVVQFRDKNSPLPDKRKQNGREAEGLIQMLQY
ncbi:hypothetical protein JX266_014426 [Neoarthrinium moseri]|nr:hypothetical protein JX266_014524 [Neoarthrinium moseri]KAI1839363.1 hypothetical protein JX266_014426 [Neoarthrinium moseri]